MLSCGSLKFYVMDALYVLMGQSGEGLQLASG